MRRSHKKVITNDFKIQFHNQSRLDVSAKVLNLVKSSTIRNQSICGHSFVVHGFQSSKPCQVQFNQEPINMRPYIYSSWFPKFQTLSSPVQSGTNQYAIIKLQFMVPKVPNFVKSSSIRNQSICDH